RVDIHGLTINPSRGKCPFMHGSIAGLVVSPPLVAIALVGGSAHRRLLKPTVRNELLAVQHTLVRIKTRKPRVVTQGCRVAATGCNRALRRHHPPAPVLFHAKRLPEFL